VLLPKVNQCAFAWLLLKDIHDVLSVVCTTAQVLAACLLLLHDVLLAHFHGLPRQASETQALGISLKGQLVR